MLISLIIIFILIIIIINIYNSLIRKKNEVENAFAGIAVQLKKRYDMIPNLVATVKEFSNHEKELLEKITALRSQLMGSSLSQDEKLGVDNEITSGIKQLLVSVENYPELKANENFMLLQRSLNEIEAQLSASRRSFNHDVTKFNNAIQIFPNNIIAGMMNLTAKTCFEVSAEEEKNVNVQELFK